MVDESTGPWPRQTGVRIALVLSLLGVAGCGGSPPLVAVSATPQVHREEAVQLRVEPATRLVSYMRTQRVTVRELGGHEVEAEGASFLQVRQSADSSGRLLRYQTHQPLTLRQDGVEQALPASLHGLERHQVQTTVDAANHVLGGPELMGSPDRGPMSAGVLALSRLLEPHFPADPVRVGESWSEPTVRWRTPPLELASVDVDRRFTLQRIEQRGHRRFARVSWDVEIRVLPFELHGVAIEGRGRMNGFSLVPLDDVVASESAFDLTLDLGPVGVSDVVSLASIDAKIRDRIERAPRGQVSGLEVPATYAEPPGRLAARQSRAYEFAWRPLSALP